MRSVRNRINHAPVCLDLPRLLGKFRQHGWWLFIESDRFFKLPVLLNKLVERFLVRRLQSSPQCLVADHFTSCRASLDMSFSHRWRNVGFMAAYIIFNVCFLVVFFPYFRSSNACRFSSCTSSSTFSESEPAIPSALS